MVLSFNFGGVSVRLRDVGVVCRLEGRVYSLNTYAFMSIAIRDDSDEKEGKPIHCFNSKQFITILSSKFMQLSSKTSFTID